MRILNSLMGGWSGVAADDLMPKHQAFNIHDID